MDTINEKIFNIDFFDEEGDIEPGALRQLLFFIYSEYANAPDNYNGVIKLVANGADFQHVDRLEGILLDIAHTEGLEPEFMDWIERTNPLNIKHTS